MRKKKYMKRRKLTRKRMTMKKVQVTTSRKKTLEKAKLFTVVTMMKIMKTTVTMITKRKRIP